MATRSVRTILALLATLLAMAVTGCGSDDDGPNRADRAFLQQMIPHHERAIAVARIGVTAAEDPRVKAFAARIVREQSPELVRLEDAARGLDLDLTAGARPAMNRISDAAVTALRRLRGTAFDRRFLQLHIGSETGAADMAETEIHGGTDPGVLALAKPIATARTTQIPELKALLIALG